MEKGLRTLAIDPEFRDLISPLTGEEREMLEASVLKEGCETPLTIWNGVIVDGHNRYEICREHRIPFAVMEKHFENRQDALMWIITNQLGRRNLSSYQRGELVMRFEPLLKAQARERQATSTGGSTPQLRQNSGEAEKAHPTTDRELGKLAGISHDTIHKVKKLSESVDDGTKEKLRRGEVSINRAYTDVMRREHAGKQRICDRCGLEKPISEYDIPSNRHRFSSLCRACEKESAATSEGADYSSATTAEKTVGPIATQSPSSIGMNKGHPIHVAAPLPDRPDMFPHLEDHMRYITGNFLAGAWNATKLYTSGMASAEHTHILREILESAAGAAEAFDEYVKEMLAHE